MFLCVVDDKEIHYGDLEESSAFKEACTGAVEMDYKDSVSDMTGAHNSQHTEDAICEKDISTEGPHMKSNKSVDMGENSGIVEMSLSTKVTEGLSDNRGMKVGHSGAIVHSNSLGAHSESDSVNEGDLPHSGSGKFIQQVSANSANSCVPNSDSGFVDQGSIASACSSSNDVKAFANSEDLRLSSPASQGGSTPCSPAGRPCIVNPGAIISHKGVPMGCVISDCTVRDKVLHLTGMMQGPGVPARIPHSASSSSNTSNDSSPGSQHQRSPSQQGWFAPPSPSIAPVLPCESRTIATSCCQTAVQCSSETPAAVMVTQTKPSAPAGNNAGNTQQGKRSEDSGNSIEPQQQERDGKPPTPPPRTTSARSWLKSARQDSPSPAPSMQKGKSSSTCKTNETECPSNQCSSPNPVCNSIPVTSTAECPSAACAEGAVRHGKSDTAAHAHGACNHVGNVEVHNEHGASVESQSDSPNDYSNQVPSEKPSRVSSNSGPIVSIARSSGVTTIANTQSIDEARHLHDGLGSPTAGTSQLVCESKESIESRAAKSSIPTQSQSGPSPSGMHIQKSALPHPGSHPPSCGNIGSPKLHYH